jgi:hypothetical protein
MFNMDHFLALWKMNDLSHNFGSVMLRASRAQKNHARTLRRRQ